MIHRLALICAFFVGFALSLSGQQVRISTDFNLRAEDHFEVLGEYGDRVLLFIDRSGKFQIESYEKDLTYVRSVPINVERRTVRMAGIVRGKNSFSLIYHFRGDKGQYFIKARKYNSQIQLIDSSTIIKYDRMPSNPQILFDVSEDDSKALIFRLVDDRNLETIVVDAWRMKTMWYETFEFDGSLRYNFREALINNRGDVFIVGEKGRRASGRPDYHLEILSYSVEGQLHKGEIEIPELRSVESTVRYDNLNHQLVSGGLYTEKGTSKTTGAYVMRINPFDVSDYNLESYPFDKNTLIDLYGANAPKRKGVDYLEPRDIIFREDGGLVFVSEITKVLSRRGSYNIATSSPSRNSRWVDYYYEDLVLLSIHPDGNLHWSTVLHKKQYSQDDNGLYSSYFLFSTPSHMRLLFNDEISNNNTVSEYIVAPDGRNDRNSVLSTDYQRLKLIFSKAVQTSGHSFIVPSERQSRLNLLRVEYE
jgi:hypothetical protein